jgi:hypothetical protein
VKGSTGETVKAVEMFRHSSKTRLLWALGERLLLSTLRVTTNRTSTPDAVIGTLR